MGMGSNNNNWGCVSNFLFFFLEKIKLGINSVRHRTGELNPFALLHRKFQSPRSVFHIYLWHFTLVILATIILSGCSSGGGSETTDGTSGDGGSGVPVTMTVIATGTVGPNGGTVSDNTGETAVIVPPGAVSTDTKIQILRDRNADGYVVTSYSTSAPISGEVRFVLPDPILLESSVPQNFITQAVAAVTSTANWFSAVAVSAVSGNAPSSYPNFGAGTKFLCDELNDLGPFQWHHRCSYFWKLPSLTSFGVGNRIDDLDTVADLMKAGVSTVTYRPATVLSSSCDFNDQTCYQGKEAVLFIHGYLVEVFGDNGFGGGQDTWGQFPSELQKLGYVPFEFRWVTGAKFEDVAGDLGKAIDQIAERTGKKVHVVAHSFGGVLARAYLQKIVAEQGFQYNENVASLTTLGSPHSGIFSPKNTYTDAAGTLEVGFNVGADALILISECQQLSCYQMGHGSLFFSLAANTFGVLKDPGEIAYKLWKTTSNLPPVPIQVLVGLTTSRGLNSNLDEGDGLISYEGQRFLPGFTWDKTPPQYNNLLNNQLIGFARVTEQILGFSVDVRPDSQNPLLGISPESVGYRHSGGLIPNDAIKMACAGCDGEPVSIADHSGVKLAAEWIKQNPAGSANLQNTFILRVKILDKVTGAPVSGATITATMGLGLDTDSAKTDGNGDAVLNVRFMPLSTYDLFMGLPGYGAVRLTPYETARIETTNTKTDVDLGAIRVTTGNTTISPVQHSVLTVSRAGTGSGSVTGRGITCPVDCVTTDVTGGQIILEAIVDAGSTFSGWSGCTSTNGVNCYVTMNTDKAVSAAFTRTMAATPTIAVGPASLNFGSIPVGTCATARIAVQHVAGTDPASGTVGISSGAGFSVVSGANFLVAGGTSQLVDVQFCPISGLSYSGVVIVTSGASFTTANTVTLSGTGTTTIALPAAPSTLTANALSQSNIALTWQDNSNNETGFKIERKTGPTGTFTEIATAGSVSGSGSGGYYENTGLTAGTNYCYRLRAYNTAGDSSYTSESCATTQAATTQPTATTNAATAITSNSAMLNGSVNPNGIATGAFFQWGTTISYGNTTPSQVIGSGTSAVNFIANLTGLAPNTVYHFRVVATNGSGGTTFGNDQSFTTFPLGSGIPVNTSIAGGSEFTLAIKNDGTVWTWGNNSSGQLGDGTTSNRFTPVQVAGLTGVKAVAAGGDNDPANQGHGIALKNDGTVWTWGRNVEGQLGDGSFSNRNAPVQVSGLTGVTSIAGGAEHTIALKGDGTVWTWGSNIYGQLGDGAEPLMRINRSSPVQVVGLTGVIAIASGAFHSIALKNDGTVWTWGENSQGMLGDGTTTDSSTPVQVNGLTGVTAIAGGWIHTVALKNDGTVWTWGDNLQGELGDGTFTDSLIPVQVSGLTGVTAIAAGLKHTLALKSDGTVWAWGYNGDSALGDGTVVTRNIAVQTNELASITAIAAGTMHSIALKSDGSAWTWGGNNYGELGDGATTNKSTPVQVNGFSGVTPPSSDRIVFVSDRDGNAEIYAMNADGSEQNRLTNNTFADYGPSPSPDGTRIAFSSYRNDNFEIYIMNADGSGQTRLASSAYGRPAWSPDSLRIAFTSSRDGDIYVINADGSGQTRLTYSGWNEHNPAWSHNGNLIAFTSGRSANNYEIYVMNVDGSGQTRLTYTTAIDDVPAWSHDDNRIFFDSERDGNYEIYVMNVDGSGQARLTNNTFTDSGPSQSSDGALIIFSSDRDGDAEIYVMNADGSGQTRLTNIAGADGSPAWLSR
ncbi:MAG: DUF5050 domain-containing protein [Pseudomonadota bacterium]